MDINNTNTRMDKTLKNIYIKLDSGLQSLTKSAKAQVIIKLVYNARKEVSQNEILNLYTAEFKGSIDSDTLTSLLDSLVSTGELNKKAKLYTIPRSKKNKIKQNYEESENRKLSIIESFKPFHSSDSIVAEWLDDATMHFFSMYSENWISDICRERSKAISSSKESIIQAIERRTDSNKKIDVRDKGELVNKFITFISSRANDTNAFLWEYGTSAFVAKLIANSTGLDTLSLNAFSNSKCILDTNILMHMGLESSEYYNALKSIEKIFLKLNIEVGYFSITEEEYIRTVCSKKTEIISSLNNGFKENVLKESNDQYIKTAIHRGCRLTEDYERFFQH